MKTKDIIAAVKNYQLKSNMHIVDIVEDLSDCRCVPMNSPAHVIVFDTVEDHGAWTSALTDLGYRVETIEITRRSSSTRWDVKRRYIGFPGYEIDGRSVTYHCDGDREYAYGLDIMEA